MKLLENGYLLEFPQNLVFTDNELFTFCKKNPDLNIERDKNQNLIIMSPSGSLSDHFSHLIATELEIWNRKEKKGIVFGSSSGFILPDDSMRSPDVAWVSNDQWNALSKDEKMKFAPVCPEFIVEVKSPSDSLRELIGKMSEWMTNGVKLAWLVDTEEHKVYVYSAAGEETVETFDAVISGKDVLPGFELDLRILKED